MHATMWDILKTERWFNFYLISFFMNYLVRTVQFTEVKETVFQDWREVYGNDKFIKFRNKT